MIEQNVQVLRCDNKNLWVRMGTRSGCSACDNGEGCGAGLFSKLMRRKPVTLKLKREDVKVEAGQMLTLAFPEQVYLKMVFASYGWPLIAALAGAFAGYNLGKWLQFTPAIIDSATLLSGILAAWFVLRVFRSRNISQKILDSLHMTVCIPSNTPNMCTATVKNPKHS